MAAKRHYLIYVLFAALNVAVSYALLLFFANTLSKDDYAAFGVVTSLAGIALIFVNFGHKEALFKATSQSDTQALGLLARSLRPWLLGVTFLGLILCLVQPEWGIPALAFTAVYLLIVVASVFRGRGHYAKDAAAWPVYRALWLSLGVFGFWALGGLSLSWVFGFALISALLAIILLGGFSVLAELSVRAGPPRLPFSNPTLINFFVLELATVAYLKLDVLLLNWLGFPSAEVAEYFFAVQLFEAAMLVLAPLAYLFFNRFNDAGGQQTLSLALLPFVASVIAIVALMMLVWQWLGEVLLSYMFPAYRGSFSLVGWLLLALIPMGLNMLLSHALFALHKERVYAAICALGLAVCLIANLILIQNFAAQGAAWSRLITEVFIFCGLLVWFAHRKWRAAR